MLCPSYQREYFICSPGYASSTSVCVFDQFAVFTHLPFFIVYIMRVTSKELMTFHWASGDPNFDTAYQLCVPEADPAMFRRFVIVSMRNDLRLRGTALHSSLWCR